MASSDQEAPGRSSGTEMDPAAAAAAATGQALDEKRHRMTTGIDDDAVAAAAAAPSLWAFLLLDILGVVLRFLPCLADRAAVRSVCRHWRDAAHGHNLPPPLPLLVLPRYWYLSFSTEGEGAMVAFSFSTKGAMVAMRRRWMLPAEVATGHLRCVGSSEGWLLMARPSEDGVGSERFLVNTFQHEIIHLPRLYAPYCTTAGKHPWIADDYPKYSKSLNHVVLSAPPGSATRCIAAGFSYRRDDPRLPYWRTLPGITLWKPGMKTWYVYQCHTRSIYSCSSDLVFHQEKLYMLDRSWYAFESSPLLFAFTLGEDEHGVNVSGHMHQVNIPPIPRPSHARWSRCNLLLWRGVLMVIIRYLDTCKQTEKVDVFALDLSIDPCGVTEIHSFDGDCVFVDRCRCTSFPAGSYAGVQGDCIYFIDNKYNYDGDRTYLKSYATTVYNMGDGTVKPFFSADLLSGMPARDNPANAVWMFPSQ